MAQEEVREQDRYLPIANISRIMKKSLPPNAKIAKDAKETVQECVSEFISFITSEASDKVQQEKRKTITGDDVLWAMSTLGFDKYVEPLKVYLQKYRDSVKGGDSKKQLDEVAAAAAAAAAPAAASAAAPAAASAAVPGSAAAASAAAPAPGSAAAPTFMPGMNIAN